MSSRRIEDCVPALQKAWPLLKQAAKDQLGLDLILTCTARSAEEQRVLYAQGRESIEIVNHLRSNSGLPEISEHENRKVTWTLDSKHIINAKRAQAEAFDVALLNGKQFLWDIKVDVRNDGIPDYEELARIGESLGLKPGARFSTPDYPHFEV